MDQEKDISQAFKEAPSLVQKYLLSSAFDDDIQNLAISEKLTPESFQVLKNITTMIILGIAEPFEFTSILADSLVITSKTADSVIEKISILTEKIIENMLDESAVVEVKNISIQGDNKTSDLRSTILAKTKDLETTSTSDHTPSSPKTFMSSRSLLMDQLSLIGQIPKDEDVMTRLNKIKEQLRKGEEKRKKLDEEIRAREEKEKYKHALKPTTTVPRKVYDVDPYREQVEESAE